MDQEAGAHQAPYVTKQDSKNKDLAFIKNMLQKEPEMNDEDAKKLAGSVLEDILNGRVPFKEGADQWWGKSLRVKGNPKEGTKDEYFERIPVKNLKTILSDRLDDILINRKEGEMTNFGIFMRYLIHTYDKKRNEVEEQIWKAYEERTKEWFECESWGDAPKLWENVATFFTPMFHREHCADMVPFGIDEFKRMINACYLKDDFGEYNYKGVVAINMLRKLIGCGILKNEFDLRQFWAKSEFNLGDMYNKDSTRDFNKAVENCALKHLNMSDMHKEIGMKFIDTIEAGFEVQAKINALATESFDLKPQFNTPESDRIAAVFFQISMHVLTTYHDTELQSYAEQIIAEFMTVFEHAIKDVNDSLEMELLYATECIYSKLKAENKAGKIGKVMQDLWDSYSFNKSTLLVEWKSERNGQVMFRGTDSTGRNKMQVEVCDFLKFVSEQPDEEEN